MVSTYSYMHVVLCGQYFGRHFGLFVGQLSLARPRWLIQCSCCSRVYCDTPANISDMFGEPFRNPVCHPYRNSESKYLTFAEATGLNSSDDNTTYGNGRTNGRSKGNTQNSHNKSNTRKRILGFSSCFYVPGLINGEDYMSGGATLWISFRVLFMRFCGRVHLNGTMIAVDEWLV